MLIKNARSYIFFVFSILFSPYGLLKRACAALGILYILCTCTLTLAEQITIENFNDRTQLYPWTFSNGAEFPGATGSFSLSTGFIGAGADLAYNFECINPNDYNTCGHYVIANFPISQIIYKTQGARLSFWAKWPTDTQVRIRLRDETGQTFQYHPTRSLLNTSSNHWTHVEVPLDKAKYTWGGANDAVFHGRITSIGIMTGDPLIFPTTGVLSVDEVSLMPPPSTVLVHPNVLSTNIYGHQTTPLKERLGVATHFTNGNDIALAYAKNAGFSFVRTDLFWSQIEHQGTYNFSAYDSLVASLEQMGMGALFILDYGHWDHSSGYCVDMHSLASPCPPRSPEELHAFAQFVYAAVTHFKYKNVRFEIWNEPNIQAFWTSGPNPEEYASLVSVARTAARQANPNVTLAVSGLSGMDFPFYKRFLAADIANDTDAIAMHPYRATKTPETAGAAIMALQDLVKSILPQALPLWDTEWGYTSAANYYGNSTDGSDLLNRHRQAILNVRKILTEWTLNLPTQVIYDLRDDGTDSYNAEHNYGLIDANNIAKPAIAAIQQLSVATNAFNFSGLVNNLPHGLYAIKLENDDFTRFVVWQSETDQAPPIRVLLDSYFVYAQGMYGEPITLNNCTVAKINKPARCAITLNEQTGPIYLTFRKNVLLATSSTNSSTKKTRAATTEED